MCRSAPIAISKTFSTSCQARLARLSSIHSSSTPAVRCRRKLTANCAKATTTRSKVSTTTNAPGCCRCLIPPAESIQTVDVSTSDYDAELGRASGAVVNVILKSGTNNYHGTAYEFAKNNYFNARNFFDKSVGHLAYNYFGGNIGGPIVKNKLFFFADYLMVKDHEANPNTISIPTMAIRSGDLSASATTIYNPCSGTADGPLRQP